MMMSFIHVVFLLASAGIVYASSAAAGFAQFMESQSRVALQQKALAFEHIEYAFYQGALAQYDVQAFEAAGFAPWVRDRFEQIMHHEAVHVAALTEMLKSSAPQPCKYSFPYTNVKSFVSLAMTIEGLSTSSKLGALKSIEGEDDLVATGSIMATEAKHGAWVSSAVIKNSAWNLPYETPVTADNAWSIAANFITDCPATNPPLPTSDLPSIGLYPNSTTAGHAIAITLNGTAAGNDAEPIYLAYYAGLDVYHSKIRHGRTHVPRALAGAGIVYVAIVANATDTWYNGTAVSGLAVLELPTTSAGAFSLPSPSTTELAAEPSTLSADTSDLTTTEEADQSTFTVDEWPEPMTTEESGMDTSLNDATTATSPYVTEAPIPSSSDPQVTYATSEDPMTSSMAETTQTPSSDFAIATPTTSQIGVTPSESASVTLESSA